MDAGPGALRATPFGWSVMAPDLDNDGDPDVVFFGSLDGALHTITADNPGAVLLNPGCSAHFEADLDALAVDHTRRNVHGGATGDLNRDGFPDLVTASAFDIPEEVPLKRYPVEYDSPFDATAWYVEASPRWRWRPPPEGSIPDGGLAVEINTRNETLVEVRTLGRWPAAGRAGPTGRRRRLIRVTRGGRTTCAPSPADGLPSQDPWLSSSGGPAQTGPRWVLGRGTVNTPLRQGGERIVLPPRSRATSGPSLGRRKYRSCVAGAPGDLRIGACSPGARLPLPGERAPGRTAGAVQLGLRRRGALLGAVKSALQRGHVRRIRVCLGRAPCWTRRRRTVFTSWDSDQEAYDRTRRSGAYREAARASEQTAITMAGGDPLRASTARASAIAGELVVGAWSRGRWSGLPDRSGSRGYSDRVCERVYVVAVGSGDPR